MIIELNDTYRMMITMMIMMLMIIMMIMMMKTQNTHKSTNFEATTSRFCMIIDINDTYRIYFLAKFRFILQMC